MVELKWQELGLLKNHGKELASDYFFFCSLAEPARASWKIRGQTGFDSEFVGMQYEWKQRCLLKEGVAR